MSRIYVYDIADLPDCTHHRLVTLCGGDVQGRIFQAGEQLLRMIAGFEPGRLTLAFRWMFDPAASAGLQHRLRLQLAVSIAEDLSEDLVRQMIDSGPLAEFYAFKPACMPCERYELEHAFGAVCEIVRQEERIEPLVPKELNPNIPSLYYSVSPFSAREDNNYLMLDALLSRVPQPCALEMLVSPVDQEQDIEAHCRYITRLMAVNQYGDDLYQEGRPMDAIVDGGMSRQTILAPVRKKDPLADEVLREQQELQRLLRQPQLLFHIKAFATRPEHAMMLAAAAAESGLTDGKYRVISYSDAGDEDQRNLLAQSLSDSRMMDVSVHATYGKVWNRDLPKRWRGLSRLCHLATVDEIKGLVRLPIGGHGSPRCIRKSTDPKPKALRGKVRVHLAKDAPSVLPENTTFSTTDGRVVLKPCLLTELQPLHSVQPNSGETVCDVEVLAANANIQQSIGPGDVTVVNNGSDSLVRVENPSRLGGTILIGYDLESSMPTPHRMDFSDLRGEFREARSNNLELHLPLDLMTKHVFVAGVPGSGKTTAVFNILAQLFQHDVSFLVIEPAKTEYRALKTLRRHPDGSVRAMASALRIYTPGNEAISPLRFNPLAYPEGITRDEHIGQVLACFEAAMPLGGPLQALIAEAVEAVYEDREERDFPQMTDLLSAARRIMDAKQYEGEIKSNLQAAIEVRLGLLTRRAMGRIFACSDSVPRISKILRHPTIIEMDYLQQDHACLLTLFLLAAVREQIRVEPKRRSGGLHHVTVIEEAHNIVGRTGAAQASEDGANSKAFAAEYVSRMLAELRALGEGIIIADQLPSTVAPEVVKNTGTKLAHRLVANDDREELGGAMLLGEMEIEEIARLDPGEAYFYSEGLYRPRRVRCLNTNAYLRLSELPTGADIVPHLAQDEWFVQGREERALRTLTMIQQHLATLLERLHQCAALFGRGGLVPDQVVAACANSDAASRARELRSIAASLVDVRTDLERAVQREFVNRVFNSAVPLIRDARAASSRVDEIARQVEQQYNQVIGPRYTEMLTQLGRAVGKVRDLI